MPRFTQLTPMLLVNDLQETIDFYTKTLGFEVAGTYPDGSDATWCHLVSGGAQIMFYHEGDEHDHEHDHEGDHDHDHEHDLLPSCTGQFYIYPEDVNVAWDALKDRVDVIQEPR